MATPQEVQWEDVQKVLTEQPGQQVSFAQYVVNIGAIQGGVVNFASPGRQAPDLVRPVADPPKVLPRAVPVFLDREQEQRQVGQALARGQVTDLFSPDGVGKTALISRAMRTQLPSSFPDGMVYLSARHMTHVDLLQDLYTSFFEIQQDHVRATENQVRLHMAGKRALIAIDDANHLEEGEAEDLAQVVPQCAFVIMGRKQQVWQGLGLPLGGLPPDVAVALFEHHWGGLSPQDRPAAEAICAVLDRVPLAIVKTASTARNRQVPLAQVLQQVKAAEGAAGSGPSDPVREAFWMVAAQLSEEERRVLAGLAAPGGATVAVEALPAITGLPREEVGRCLQTLQRVGLVHTNSPRYGLDDGFRPYVRHAWVDEAMQARAADYYLQQAGRLRGRARDPDEENVGHALGYFWRRRQWRQVVHIAQAAERYLATMGRWGQWRRWLRRAWRAARELGDRGTEAWAQNQLGIIAMGLEDASAAAAFFQGALAIWQVLGDHAGMTIARWNLRVLFGAPPPPPPPPPKAETPPKAGGGGAALPIALAVTAVVLIIGLALLVGVIGGRDRPTPPIPSPRIEVRLAAGCDRDYPPGQPVVLRISSSVDGRVDVYLAGEDGGRELLFSTEIQAQQVASHEARVPNEEGDWALEAELNDGEAHDRCAFSTAAGPVPPVIEDVWIEPVGGEQVCPGDEVTVYARVVSDAGLERVELVGRPPGGSWEAAEMERVDDQTFLYVMAAHAEPGIEFGVLAEDTLGNQAESERQVYVVPACERTLYDFVEMAPKASWTGRMPMEPYVYGLEFPGKESDERGYARWVYEAVLEDGSSPDHRVLETHPTMADGGSIWGQYNLMEPISVVFQPGDLFVARVGFLEEAYEGEVVFKVSLWDGDPDASPVELDALADRYDGEVIEWTIPLDEFAGQSGYVYLSVDAAPEPVQDRAVWVEARIERP